MSNNPFLAIFPTAVSSQKVKQPSIVEHMRDIDPDCESRISYTLQQVLMVLVQKITGDQTHVIFSNISTEIDNMCKEFEIDLKKKTATMYWNNSAHYKCWYIKSNKVRKKLVTYPGTDIKFYISLKIDYISELYKWDSGKYINGKFVVKSDITNNCNYAEVSVYVPQKRITFTEASMQEVLAEGDLLDMSSDIEEPELKTDSKKNKKKNGGIQI